AVFDRRGERNPLKRPLATTLLVLVIGGSIGLIFLAKHQDRTNPEFAEKLKRQDEEMRAYFDKPFEAQVIGGSASLANGGKPQEPPQAFAGNCARFPGEKAEGLPPIAPPLLGGAGKPPRGEKGFV